MAIKNKIAGKIIISLFLGIVFLCINISAQNPDSLQPINIEFITDQLENIAQSSDINLDYSDLIDDYLYYSKNPININGSKHIFLEIFT